MLAEKTMKNKICSVEVGQKIYIDNIEELCKLSYNLLASNLNQLIQNSREINLILAISCTIIKQIILKKYNKE